MTTAPLKRAKDIRDAFGGIFSSKDIENGWKEFGPKDVEEELSRGQHKMWSISGDNYFPCEKTVNFVPPGQYIPCVSEQRGPFLSYKNIELDDLLTLPDSKTTEIIAAIKFFWSREEIFRQYGFLWKRGVLLWGPPGSGKTTCLQQISMEVIAMGGVSLYCNNPSSTAEVLRVFRRIEPTRPLVVMIEDIDAIIERYGESDLLALLDGELQVDNVVFIATTNYPEKLDKRFSKRPSRFDDVVYVGMPNELARREYLLKKNPRLAENTQELDYWVSITKDFSMAFLKEVVVAVECLGANLEVTIERLKKMNQINVTSESSPDKPHVGFT
jgi:SpoVK/Ycf46/Vps4 family AAA+-type ATPase